MSESNTMSDGFEGEGRAAEGRETEEEGKKEWGRLEFGLNGHKANFAIDMTSESSSLMSSSDGFIDTSRLNSTNLKRFFAQEKIPVFLHDPIARVVEEYSIDSVSMARDSFSSSLCLNPL